mgnify:CR=1 FL=1
MVRLLLCSAALSMLLIGCDRPEPKVIDRPVPVQVYVPEENLSCPDIPKSVNYIKSRADATAYQSEVAAYVAALHRTARVCKVNLETVNAILKDFASIDFEKKGAEQ